MARDFNRRYILFMWLAYTGHVFTRREADSCEFVNHTIQTFFIYFVALICLLLTVMNSSCDICRELFFAASDVFVTGCGHLFHYASLNQWIAR